MASEIVSWDGAVSEVEQLSYTSGSQYGVSTSILYKCYLSDGSGGETWCSVPESFSVRQGHTMRMLYRDNNGVAAINLNNGQYHIFGGVQDSVAKLLLALIPILLVCYMVKNNVFVGSHINIYGYLFVAAYMLLPLYFGIKLVNVMKVKSYIQRMLRG